MRRHLLTLLLLALIAPFSSSQAPGPVTSVKVMLEDENMPILISLGKDLDDPLPLPSEPIRLKVETVVVKEGETIQDLLRYRNGIDPDLEAFTLVYLLNPGLESLKRLPAATSVRLPKAQGGPQFEAALKKSYRVFLMTEPEIKDQFAKQVETYQNLMTEILNAKGSFESDEIRKPASDSITKIGEKLDEILSGILRRNGRPITKEPLEQLCSETKLINEVFHDAISGKKKIGGHEQEIFQSVEEDISIKQRGPVEVRAGDPPPPWPKVKVTVQAVPAGKKLESIRFMCVPVALAVVEKPRPFPYLSSPSSIELTEAAYFFWGAKPGGDNAEPITEKLKYLVIKNSQGEITIQLKMK
jgi:hypothetical protein